MINSTFQVTFGIEVECILAFHESLLRGHLNDTNSNSKIIKDLPEDVRQKLNQVPQRYLDDDKGRHDESRQMYHGWALTTPTSYSEDGDDGKFQEHMDLNLEKYGYRAYGGEILHIAQKLLPVGVEINDSFNKHTDFSHWHLTHEQGLVGASKENLMQRLEKLSMAKAGQGLTIVLKQPSMTKDWNTHPLELVSRVLPYNFASIKEVHQHLAALQEGFSHFAYATQHCGLHVHVGLPVPANYPAGKPPPTFTLPTLQHLAYIQIMYESKISDLHPKSRGDYTNVDLKSNIEEFIEEVVLTDADYEALDARIEAGEPADVVYAEEPPTLSFKKARAKIFAKDMTVEKLSKLMGGNDKFSKYRIVNWTYVTRTRGEARTLEFRQHQGTLFPVAVEHWTAFVVGLVRLAEHHSRRYGAAADYDGSGYRYQEVSEERSVWDLTETMELGDGEMEYWRGVVAKRVQGG